MSLDHNESVASTADVASETTAAGGASQALFILPSEGVDLDELERSLIEQALTRTRGNQTQAARLLGLSRYALRYRAQKYGLAERFPTNARG